MDRLICGDVGYGKTEVALRAAFKAVGRQAGDAARADDDPRPAALRHVHRAAERLPDHDRARVALPLAARRSARRVKALPRGAGRHPDRHPPPALARRARQGPRPADRRRGAALRRQAEGAAAAAQAEGRRDRAVGHADPAHAADVARRDPRHLGDRDAARGPPAGAAPTSASTTRSSCAGDRRASSSAAARPSSCTTASSRSTRPPSACARCARRRASRSPTARWTRSCSRSGCSPSCAATPTCSSARASSSRASTSRRPTR